MVQSSAIGARINMKLPNLSASQFQALLSRYAACTEAVDWARGKTLRGAWEQCNRADWLLWLLGKMAGTPTWPNSQTVVLAACDCAKTALIYIPPGEKRPAEAIAAARRWAINPSKKYRAKAIKASGAAWRTRKGLTKLYKRKS